MRRRPFVIFACCGQWAALVNSLRNKHKRQRFLFTQQRERKLRDQVRSTLQDINEGYDLRSVRRGAIECLATTMMPQEIMEFSGHANVAMTMRYLRWGATATLQGTTMANAAREALH